MRKKKKGFPTGFQNSIMTWFCLNCGRRNEDTSQNCGKCKLDRERALTMHVINKRKSCDECGHMHREGFNSILIEYIYSLFLL